MVVETLGLHSLINQGIRILDYTHYCIWVYMGIGVPVCPESSLAPASNNFLFILWIWVLATQVKSQGWLHAHATLVLEGMGQRKEDPQGLLAGLSTKVVNSSSIKRPCFEKKTRSHNRKGNSMSNSLHANEHTEAHMHTYKCVCIYPDEKLQLSLTKKCKVSPNFLHCFKKVYTVRQ